MSQMPARNHWPSATEVLADTESKGGDAKGQSPRGELDAIDLSWLITEIDVSSLAPQALEQLAGKVADKFGPIDRALDDLAGDPGPIEALSQTLTQVSCGLTASAKGFVGARAETPLWNSFAANSFQAYFAAEQEYIESAGKRSALISDTNVCSRWWYLLAAIGAVSIPALFPAILAGMVADFISYDD